ncbi:Cysteine dioxygenase [Blyttiomyces sp. JEL0837]|nr:Cysteine dioxygenase [Blyttiomyces sp. JEL0837]
MDPMLINDDITMASTMITSHDMDSAKLTKLKQQQQQSNSEIYDDETTTASTTTLSSSINLQQLIQGLHKELGDKGIDEMDKVDVDKIQNLMESYMSNEEDWSKFAHFDKGRYTRNLVDAGNGKFNLMVLCWPETLASLLEESYDHLCTIDGDGYWKNGVSTSFPSPIRARPGDFSVFDWTDLVWE